MADKSKPGAGNPPSPSFYSAAAGMDGKKPADPGAGTSAGQAGEKVKNVKVLLEVFDKMDKLEQEPENKTLIQQMVDMAKQYLNKLEGKPGDDKGKPPMPATGEAGSGGMGAGDA